MARINRLLTPKVTTQKDRATKARPAKAMAPKSEDAEGGGAGGWENRKWHEAERILAANLAGQGWRADAIAYAMGGTTGPGVRAMLGRYDVKILAHGPTHDALMLWWKATDRQKLDQAAFKRDRDPMELAALIVRKVLAGGDKAIDALVDELDVIG